MKIPPLRSGTVQVWRMEVGSTGALLARAHQVLSAQERERAGRMRAGLPREEFMAGRGLLRLLLGNALQRAPEALQFQVGAQGKPSLAECDGVEFNGSHARGVVLLALSRDGAVGVDLEPRDRAVEAMELAQAHFHAQEAAAIEEEQVQVRRMDLFFRCWTRKEAVAKADGRGLQIGLDRFCVLGPTWAGQGTDQTSVEVKVPGGRTMWVRDIDVAAGFAGALAVLKREIVSDRLQAELYPDLMG